MKTDQKKRNQVKMFVCLGTQPVVKTVANGSRMANFYAMNVGDKSESTPMCKWFRVISWGKLADAAQKHLQKGKRVVITGSVQREEVRNRKGELRIKECIVATNFILTENMNRAA